MRRFGSSRRSFDLVISVATLNWFFLIILLQNFALSCIVRSTRQFIRFLPRHDLSLPTFNAAWAGLEHHGPFPKFPANGSTRIQLCCMPRYLEPGSGFDLKSLSHGQPTVLHLQKLQVTRWPHLNSCSSIHFSNHKHPFGRNNDGHWCSIKWARLCVSGSY